MVITIKDVAFSRQEWIERMQLSDDIAASAIKADVLVVPSNYVNRPLAFPVSTMDFYSLIKNQMGDSVEICVNEVDCEEIELNSHTLRLPTLKVKDYILPFVIGFMVNFVYDRTAAPPQPDLKADVNVEVIIPEYQKPTEMDFTIEVEDSVGNSKAFHYNGSAADFKAASDEIIRMWDEEKRK